jgi:hypothetical protein
VQQYDLNRTLAGDLLWFRAGSEMFRSSQIQREFRGVAMKRLLPWKAAILAFLFVSIGYAAINISPSKLPDWTVNSSYSQNLTAVGCTGTCTWSVSGTLPPGLSISTLNGTISGVLTTAGTFGFTVTATDILTKQGSQSYSITVNPPPSITTGALPNGTAGTAYSQTVTVAGGTPPYNFSVNTGNLPTGLALNASSGVISGIPTLAGTSNFTILVMDRASVTVSQAYVLTVNPTITITTASPLPAGTAGSVYSQTLSASGGIAPYTWSVSGGALPLGITLNSSTGVLGGTPAAVGTFTFTVQVVDSSRGAASKQFTLTIAQGAPTLTITSISALPSGSVGTPYSQTLTASGGTVPYTWTLLAGNLPAGVSLTSSNGLLSGTPAAAGTFAFTVQVTDAATGKATQSFSLAIGSNTSSLSITTTSPLPAGSVGAAYTQTLAATGGRPPYSWSIITGALPGGLSLNAATGVIAGTATATGSFTFDVRVTDSSSATADQLLSITVSQGGPNPTLSISGVPANAVSAQQIPFDVVLSAALARTVAGQVALTFQPSGAASRDDPAVQFASGSRSISFTIPAGSTHATFSSSPAAFQTGTVAGTIKLSLTSDLSGGTATASTVVAAAAPVISSATVVTNSAGFQVQLAGFSNSRDLAGVSFHFTAKSGQILQTSDLTVNLASLASQWYGGSSSTPFGGQFLLVVPFTVQQGAASALASVSVQLQNSQAASQTATANF